MEECECANVCPLSCAQTPAWSIYTVRQLPVGTIGFTSYPKFSDSSNDYVLLFASLWVKQKVLAQARSSGLHAAPAVSCIVVIRDRGQNTIHCSSLLPAASHPLAS
jgi:hypothetical protein